MSEIHKGDLLEHEDTIKLLPLYLSGELDNQTSNKIKKHLENWLLG
jgi:anti-anti-sigma regulatory factor